MWIRLKPDFNSLRAKASIFLIFFTVLILMLLWILQVAFFTAYYRMMKTSEVARVGNELFQRYGAENYEEIVGEYSYKHNLRIMIFHGDSKVRLFSDSYRVYAEAADLIIPPEDVQEFIVKLNMYSPICYIAGTDIRTNIIYGAKLSDGSYLYISSPLPSVDSSVDVLKNQMMMITGILLMLSLVAAQFISKRLAAPLIRLTKSARRLAKGEMDTEFYSGGYTEIHELSSALSYAAKELSNMDEYRKELIANVSHDLKTPLTIIKFYAEMIKDVSGENPEKRNSHCNIIVKETDRLTGLVEEVLELSKLQSNSAEIKKTTFCLSNCLAEILSGFQALSLREGYTFHLNISEKVNVQADEQLIKRAIYNLISNAVNYTGPDKNVYVNLTERRGIARFEVRDTGKGIPKEKLANIWERYYKANETHQRAVVGSGLGLSIVKNILRAHGAEYGVDSVSGKGSMFWFELRGE